MQEPPILFRIHQCIRYGMCRMSAHLQFSELACAESAPVIRLLSTELAQWSLIHEAVEKSLLAASGAGPGLLAALAIGHLTTGQLCAEMQGNTQRWLADENPMQRLQLGAIVTFRFHAFMAHSLLHMNHGEKIVRCANHRDVAGVMEYMDRYFSQLPATAAWILQNGRHLQRVKQQKGGDESDFEGVILRNPDLW